MSYFCDDAEFTRLAALSRSPSSLVRLLGRAVGGNNVELVKREAARLGLDTSHWNGAGRVLPKVGSSQVLIENGVHATSVVKRVVLRERLIPYTCALCGRDPEWNGRPLVLRLDHVNGVRTDHRITNLRFLCPNCDSQTETYCGGNRRIYKDHKRCSCGAVIQRRSTACKSCSVKARNQPPKAEWPPDAELLRRVRESSFLAVARALGVSDNAVRKHMRARHLVVEGS